MRAHIRRQVYTQLLLLLQVGSNIIAFLTRNNHVTVTLDNSLPFSASLCQLLHRTGHTDYQRRRHAVRLALHEFPQLRRTCLQSLIRHPASHLVGLQHVLVVHEVGYVQHKRLVGEVLPEHIMSHVHISAWAT